MSLVSALKCFYLLTFLFPGTFTTELLDSIEQNQSHITIEGVEKLIAEIWVLIRRDKEILELHLLYEYQNFYLSRLL